MDIIICTLNLVLACQIDDFSIEKLKDVHRRPEEVYSKDLWVESLAHQGEARIPPRIQKGSKRVKRVILL